uniref:Uncharacterized protein n=1 Tax=Romanomermis culicivorax TaxID=13658 RepID=A0A915IY79_ROMCU
MGTNWLTVMANAFGEMLCPVNDDVSIIKVSPFPMATAHNPGGLVFFMKGLVINFPDDEEPISLDDDEE